MYHHQLKSLLSKSIDPTCHSTILYSACTNPRTYYPNSFTNMGKLATNVVDPAKLCAIA